MADILNLQDLYLESLILETIQKTVEGELVWTNVGSNQYTCNKVVNDPFVVSQVNVWDLFVTRVQLGSVSFNYVFNMSLNGTPYLSVEDGPLVRTQRESNVKDLYDTVENIVLNINEKTQQALVFVQTL